MMAKQPPDIDWEAKFEEWIRSPEYAECMARQMEEARLEAQRPPAWLVGVMKELAEVWPENRGGIVAVPPDWLIMLAGVASRCLKRWKV